MPGRRHSTAGACNPLGGLLDAIAAEVMRRAAGAEAEIMAWYLAGVMHALRHTSRNELPAVLRALKAERTVRLAGARRKAANERRALQQAAARPHRCSYSIGRRNRGQHAKHPLE